MPPKRKGKKVVSNRGFSTTSIPAKRKEEDVVEVPVDELPPAEQPVAVQAGAPVSIEDEEWSPEAMELHELQTLGDKIRLSGDKEVSRISKGIDYERRLAKSLPAYHFTEPDLVRPHSIRTWLTRPATPNSRKGIRQFDGGSSAARA